MIRCALVDPTVARTPVRSDACPVCGHATAAILEATVLGRHPAHLHRCANCGLLRYPDPYWLAEAYDGANAGAIATTDTGLLERNLWLVPRVASVLALALGCSPGDRFLDYAGGYGVFARLMRDRGFDFRWADPYCDNLMARGFELAPDEAPCRVVTAFEVLEHVVDPLLFVREALERAGDAQAMVFSTQLHDGAPPPRDWWYYAFETGQHIAFYQPRTLAAMARELGMHFASAGGLHVFSHAPVSPVLLRLCTGRAAGAIARLAARRFHSLTRADHARMVARLRGGSGA